MKGNPNNVDGLVTSNTENSARIVNTYVVNAGDLAVVMSEKPPLGSGNIYGKFLSASDLIAAVNAGVENNVAEIFNVWGNDMRAGVGFSGGNVAQEEWGVPSFDGFDDTYWTISDSSILWGACEVGASDKPNVA